MKATVTRLGVPGVLFCEAEKGKEIEVITPINVAPPKVGEAVEVVDGYHQYTPAKAKAAKE